MGLPRPTRRGGGGAELGVVGPRRDRGLRHRPSSTTRAARACCATPPNGSATSTARPAGSTSTNDYKTLDLTYMEIGHVGVQDAVGQGPGVRGLQGVALLLAVRDAALATSRPAWTTSTKTGRIRPSPSRSSLTDGRASARVDDHAVDAAVEPRARRRARHRLRRRRAATARGTSSPRPRLDAYERELGGADAGGHAQGLRARRALLRAAVPVLRRQQPNAFRVLGAPTS